MATTDHGDGATIVRPNPVSDCPHLTQIRALGHGACDFASLVTDLWTLDFRARLSLSLRGRDSVASGSTGSAFIEPEHDTRDHQG
jgi:hypothetical protein